MASLIHMLRDILPMLKPGKVQVQKASPSRLDDSADQARGILTKDVLVGMCDTMCASIMIAHPHTSSAIHHHGEQDTIIYAASGHGTIVTNPSLLTPSSSAYNHDHAYDPSIDASHLTRYDLSPGDFALIPAWTEHQEVNASDEDVVWIVARSGSAPVVVNLEDWGRGEVKV